MTTKPIIAATQQWLSKFVIHYAICPFAKPAFDKQSIRYREIEGHELEQHLLELITESAYLSAHSETETSLLIFSQAYQDFDEFLDLIAIAEELMIQQGYEGIFQLASFHPDYYFAGTHQDDAENYTNRSPWPMLHIIREASIEQVLAKFQNPEQIPSRNIKLTQELGADYLKQLLNSCQKSD